VTRRGQRGRPLTPAAGAPRVAGAFCVGFARRLAGCVPAEVRRALRRRCRAAVAEAVAGARAVLDPTGARCIGADGTRLVQSTAALAIAEPRLTAARGGFLLAVAVPIRAGQPGPAHPVAPPGDVTA